MFGSQRQDGNCLVRHLLIRLNPYTPHPTSQSTTPPTPGSGTWTAQGWDPYLVHSHVLLLPNS